jgi:hypothetical protein
MMIAAAIDRPDFFYFFLSLSLSPEKRKGICINAFRKKTVHVVSNIMETTNFL